ncbi:glycosyltransferase [Fictibacillus barbaricus]|uniref:Glycosyltransferase n=1 Tax=Fictibacillus barbaricus TaxID=182136 RepID=A0ABS2ZGP1_9BACL|nr:glycosyltransferase [Fictibacillus barbaricus]MBN3546493.1 glycosyltransferase [Fictibacillus barbaricus]GGB41471.1 glycosyl transferase [Fictibacillus barbaricus]
MKILYVSPRFPYPPKKGDQLRAYNQLKGLKSLGHEVHLISFGNTHPIPLELQHLCSKVTLVPLSKRTALNNMFFGLFKGWPLQTSLYFSNKLLQAMKQATSETNYDVVHHQLVRLHPYQSSIKHVPNVIDFVDSISLNLIRSAHIKKSLLNPIIRWEARNVRNMEQLASSNYDGGIFISDIDKNNVSLNRDTLITIANGVDLEYFSFQKQLTNNNSLIFVGNMSYSPNREGVKYFIKYIFPLIKEKIEDFTFYVVGRNPTKDLIRLCEKHENIILTGEVDDVRKYLWNAKLFVCPLKSGAGLQNKVLEAMSCGIPVITTSIVSEPIKAKDGQNIIVRDRDEEFAQTIVQLLTDQIQLNNIRNQARTFVENNYKWEHLNVQLVDFYNKTINKHVNGSHPSQTEIKVEVTS